MAPLLFLVLGALVASACADCEACVNGWCHSKKVLIEGFDVTDQLAIDQTNNVLYVQLNSNINSAIYLDEVKIKQVSIMNTSGMAVDQDTQDLYIADYNRTIYKHKYGTETLEIASINIYEPDVDLLFYKNILYYTSRHLKGLSFIRNAKYKYYNKLVNYTITDFVVNKDNNSYFVADDKLYVYKSVPETVKLVSEKAFVLSTDKQGDVYLGYANENVIYKVNESDELEEYAAYNNGSVDKFVFDNNNNIVFHDAADGNIFTWKIGLTACEIHPPSRKYSIEEKSAVELIDEDP